MVGVCTYLCAGVDAQECHSRPKSGIETQRVLGEIWLVISLSIRFYFGVLSVGDTYTGLRALDVTKLRRNLRGSDKGVDELLGIVPLPGLASGHRRRVV